MRDQLAEVATDLLDRGVLAGQECLTQVLETPDRDSDAAHLEQSADEDQAVGPCHRRVTILLVNTRPA